MVCFWCVVCCLWSLVGRAPVKFRGAITTLLMPGLGGPIPKAEGYKSLSGEGRECVSNHDPERF